MIIEGRAFARKKVEAELKCGISIVKDIYLLDISQSGALVRSFENLKIDNEYIMVFQNHQMGHFSVKAKVVRCDLVRPKTVGASLVLPIYNAGLKFIDIDKEKLRKISALITEEEQIAQQL